MLYRFDIYVSDHSIRARTALANLQRLCREAFGESVVIQVIDVLERPDLAEAQGILATPTLIQRHPLPERWLIGDLSETEQLWQALAVDMAGAPDAAGS